jgi:putative ABC transport system permease protein
MRLSTAQRERADEERRGRRPARGEREMWRARHADIFSAARLALLRLTRSAGLLAAVALGILVAVVLICTVPLYNTLVADLQLQRAINYAGPSARNVEAQAQSATVDATLRTRATSEVLALGHQYLRDFTAATSTYYAVSDDLLLVAADAQKYDLANPATSQVDFLALDLPSAAPHLHLVAGGLPADGASMPQALISGEMAHDLGLTVGSHVTVTQFGDHRPNLTFAVAGVYDNASASDPYWNGITFDAGGGAKQPKIYPLLLSDTTFFQQLPVFASVGMRQHWIFYTHADAIDTGNMTAVAQHLADFRAHINGDVLTIPGVAEVAVMSGLGSNISDIQQQEALLALPLYVIVAQVVGLALLFVAAMAGLLIEGQSQDIATLKSRGAGGTQLLTTFALQGLFVAILAALAGPFIAALLGLALVHWFVPSGVLAGAGVSADYFSRASSPRTVAIPAIVGAALGVLAVAASALQSARLDVLAFRREQARTSREPFWRRYYLDVALAVLCLAGYVELGQFGGVATRQQLGSSSASPLLLAAPALLLLAGALVVLRLLPLGARLGARLASRGRGLTPMLAFAQVERSPRRYSRMTLLLVLAVGLGLFALTFDASLQRNAYDQSSYAVGADVSVVENSAEGSGRGTLLAAQMAHLPGVLGVTSVYRTQAATTPDQGANTVDVLGIDPATFAQVAGPVSWRNDYASQPLQTLLAHMRQNARGLGAGTSHAPLWALVSSTFAAQLHVGMGDQFTLQLSETPFGTTGFVVGAIVDEFPTMYPAHAPGSFVVVAEQDYFQAIMTAAPGGDTSLLGPNEFWLRTTSDPGQHAALLRALGNPTLDVRSDVSLSDLLAQARANPVSAGMRGLLLIGAVTAALLAVLGSVVQTLLAARQRATQFAVLRTLGMAGSQLSGLLLGEQVLVYVFGLLGGTVLGMLLVTATLPFLQFSNTTIDPTRLGIPPYLIVFNLPGIGVFYAALLVAFALGLAVAARYATTIGLGNALRLGED